MAHVIADEDSVGEEWIYAEIVDRLLAVAAHVAAHVEPVRFGHRRADEHDGNHAAHGGGEVAFLLLEAATPVSAAVMVTMASRRAMARSLSVRPL